MTALAVGVCWSRMIAAWMPDGRFPCERYRGHLLGVDEHVEAMRQRDAVACGDEGLRFDRFVAVASEPDPGAQPGLPKHVVDQTGGGAVVGADPDLVAELRGGDADRFDTYGPSEREEGAEMARHRSGRRRRAQEPTPLAEETKGRPSPRR